MLLCARCVARNGPRAMVKLRARDYARAKLRNETLFTSATATIPTTSMMMSVFAFGISVPSLNCFPSLQDAAMG